jgi:sterol desaturase/sphingolipid hydroxylase (fatty acid hydroxylase superfamily)
VLPILVTAVAVATGTLLGSDLPRPAASGLPLLSALRVILALERLFPLNRAWNRRPDVKDLVLLVLNRFVDVALLVGLVAFVAAYGEALRLGALWPTAWPLPLQVVAGILIGETLRYAIHRYSHRPGFWWKVHRTHHEPDRMYALNGPRLHPLNYLWVAGAHVVPMLLLGAPLTAVLLVMNITGLFVIFQHANLRLRFDGLNRIFATPDVHRLHHARDATGVNYSIVLVLLDLLLGTYEPAVAEDIGVDGIGPGDR